MGAPDNPPAFPQPYAEPGMDLRDAFAGKAVAGILASEAAYGLSFQGAAHLIARFAYEVAHEMLLERERILASERPVPPSEFPEVFSDDLDAAPREGTFLMGKLADGKEQPMVWWLNWPGWREVGEMEVMGDPVAPVAWRPLTFSELAAIEIPF